MASTEIPAATSGVCAECGVAIGADALSCPACHSLTRAADLESFAAQAQAAEQLGNFAGARALWEQCAHLLPSDTVQYRSIRTRIDQIDARIPADRHSGAKTWSKRAAAGVGPVALLLWKFKTLSLVLLTKGKLLLLGLTKLKTFLSMLAFAGVYWAMYGWVFAVGLVVSIYIHEMGHVLELRKLGIPADAPMFIPGLGAFVRLRRLHITPVQDSRIGLAGPIYGLGAAAVALCVSYFTGWKAWGAIAHLGAILNLFNLIPVWQLDGSRGFRSLTRKERGILLGLIVVLWYATSNPMLLLVALGAAFRMFTKDHSPEPDPAGLTQFACLLVGLSAAAVFAEMLAR
jgi:Zn-dependent protease